MGLGIKFSQIVILNITSAKPLEKVFLIIKTIFADIKYHRRDIDKYLMR